MYLTFFHHFGQLSPDTVYSADDLFYFDVQKWIYIPLIVTYWHKKILFISLKHLQTAFCIVNALLFLIHCEQTWTHFEHSFFTDKSSYHDLSHVISIYNQLKWFNGFFFFYVFWNSCWILVAWEFNIICDRTSLFKVNILLDYNIWNVRFSWFT